MPTLVCPSEKLHAENLHGHSLDLIHSDVPGSQVRQLPAVSSFRCGLAVFVVLVLFAPEWRGV